MDVRTMTNTNNQEPHFIQAQESKENIDHKDSNDCATNNSNDNHGITVNTGLGRTSLCKLDRNERSIKYHEKYENQVANKAKETSDIKEDNDADSVEILISFNLVTAELNFDVVSHTEFDFLDRTKHAVLASTFDETDQGRGEDGVEINFERDINDGLCQTLKGQARQGLTGKTEEVLSTERCKVKPETCEVKPETCEVKPETYYYGNYNDSPDTMYCIQGQMRDKATERSQPSGESCSEIYHHQVDYEHNAVDRHPSNSGSRNWRTPRDSFSRENQNRAYHVHYNDWKRYNYDRRYGYRNNQGYNRRSGYRHYSNDRRETYYKSKNVFSFSESDLIYSSKVEHQNKNCNTPAFQTNKQITILKRGCTLDEDLTRASDVNVEMMSPVIIGKVRQDMTADGNSIPYGNYSLNITSDRKYYSTKYPTKSDQAEDGDVSGDTEEDVKSIKRKFTKSYTIDRHKPKKPKKKAPKTRMEVFQNQLRVGQLKSIFSRWKTDSLKRIKLVEELHNGTFAIKYKAIYNNEMVVLSVYIDQDTSDINAIDMVHMRNNKFIDGIRDCITGPYSSLWLLTRYYPNGDLPTLLSRDPERHVIGEVHAQFITAGLLFALDYLHQRGIVHGNIKPSKILIARNGYPVLTGYLIVDELMLEERRDVYTPAYAAPERFRGHRGTAIDIFSLGCVGYEIVTGRTPFDDGNLQALRSNILDMSYRPVFEPELFSYAGEMFIDSCLRKPLKYRFRIGNTRENFLFEEWFSTLDLYEVERQNAFSPILQAMKQIENSAKLDWYEKTVEFNWGRALDITRPYIEPIYKIDWYLTPDYFQDVV